MNKVAGITLMFIGLLVTCYDSNYMLDMRNLINKKIKKMENNWDNM